MLSTPSENKDASSYKSFSKEELKEFVEVQTWLRAVSPSSSKIYLNALKDERQYESRIVDSEEEVIRLTNRGYDCQMIGFDKWLMKRKILG